MCRHKRAVRGVAMFTRKMNLQTSNVIHDFMSLNIMDSGQLRFKIRVFGPITFSGGYI